MSLNRGLGSKIETVAQDHLHDEMIGAGGHTEADAEIELPLGGEIKVNRREYLVLLVLQRVEARQATQRAVVLKSAGNLGSDVIA